MKTHFKASMVETELREIITAELRDKLAVKLTNERFAGYH